MTKGIKFYVGTYVIFVLILILFNVNSIVGLDVPDPPSLAFNELFTEDFNNVINDLQTSNPVGWFIGSSLQIINLLISLVIFFIKMVLYLLRLFVFTIDGQPYLNLILIIFRVAIMIEIVPYVKNAIHPTTQGTN